VDYFYPATKPRLRAVSWPIFTPPRTARIAAENAVQARAANLPNITGNSQYLYTQGNGTLASRFIANNGVHEYLNSPVDFLVVAV
jgi:hypothetical protein